MNREQANEVYDILVNHAKANETNRSEFVLIMSTDSACREYRFQGNLGFGGKFYRPVWRISCYKENETPERLETIKNVNGLLEHLQMVKYRDKCF